MPIDIPPVAWSTDTVEALPAAVWVGRQLLAKTLDDAYKQDRQWTFDVGLRVVSGLHEMVAGKFNSREFGTSEEQRNEAIETLRQGLGFEQPMCTGSGSIPTALLLMLARELLRRLLEEFLVEELP